MLRYLLKKSRIPLTGRSEELAKADRAFSLYIRTRDSQKYGGTEFKCISCGRVLPIEQADDGHYCDRMHMATRFHELNVWAQCIECNRFKDGNISNYRERLVGLIGEDAVSELEQLHYTTKKLDVFDLREIANKYKNKIKEFKYKIR